jgi:aminotransferase
MKDLESYISDTVRDIPRSGIRDFFEIVAERKDVISLSIGEPDFVAPWHVREATAYAVSHGATSYTANLGMLELRTEISRYVKENFKLSYNPMDEILVTVGASEAIDIALRSLINPGDEVLYHEPCYVSYAPVISMAHGKAVLVETNVKNNFMLRATDLEKKVTDRTKVLMLNFPNNPTGATLTKEVAEELSEFAVKHDLIVITDEIYSELTYDDERISIGSFPGMQERTIFIHGMSKAWAMTGYRIGYVCAPPVLLEAMMKIHQYTIMCAPVLSQKAALEALRNGDEQVAKMRDEYNRRRNFIIAELNEMGISCHKPEGAFYVFPNIAKFGMSSKDFCMKFLDEYDVACVPGTAFGKCGEGFMRCSYATAFDSIKEAMKRLKKFVAELS